MSMPLADQIRSHLAQVASLRAGQQADAALGQRVRRLKAYQAQRFELTYADLLATPRYRAATRFFLDDLYGPQEFSQRDTQFSRVVPALVRLFPHAVVATVAQLGALHALSESLDDTTARHLGDAPLDAASYIRAWQATGRAADRTQQIGLTLAIGRALDGFTGSRLLRTSLRVMRGPAQAAGLSALQNFLEAGFDAFGAMHGAEPFLATVAQREQALADALFAPDATSRCAGRLP